MKITKEDIEFIRAAKEIIDRGNYPSGEKAVSLYKRVFEKEISEGKEKGNLSPKCGSCIRTSVNKVYEKIEELQKMIEEQLNTEKDGE